MKMSIANAIAAAAAAATGSATIVSASASMTSSSASSLLRGSATARGGGGIADTARRRASSTLCPGCNNNSHIQIRHGRGRGGGSMAFTSLLQFQPLHHHDTSSSSSAFISSSSPRYFSKKKRGEDLSWSPIIEIVHNGNNPSSSLSSSSTALQMTPNFGTEGFRDARRGSQEYIQPSRGPADKRSLQQQPQQSQPEQQQQQQQQDGQKQQQAQQPQQPPPRIPFPKLTPGRKRNYRPPHLMSAMQQAKSGMTPDERDHCDALNPTDRDHCLEDFRDGTESTRYLNVKGGGDRDRGESSSRPAISNVVAVIPPVADPVDLPQVEISAEQPALVMSSEMDTVNNGNVVDSQSEHFREGPQRVSTRSSGSDVEYMEESLLGEGVGTSLPDVVLERDQHDFSPNPATVEGNKKKTHYETLGPSSMNFRDGTRMAIYKDDAFKVVESDDGSSSATSEREVERAEESSAYEELLGEEGKVLEEIWDESEEEDIQVLLRDIAEEFEASQTVQQSDDEGTVITSSAYTASETGRSYSSSSSALLSIDPKSVDIIPMIKGKADEEGLSEDETIDLKQSLLDDTSSLRDDNGSKFNGWEGLASSGSFVKMFRGSASYIANHRGTLAVYHIPGELLAWEGFPGLMDDIALTWLLGMKIVLVAGCRHQIDLRLEEEDEYDDEEGGEGGEHDDLGGKVMMSSIRVTDEGTLRVVKEEAGFVRFEIERRLAKSLRVHGGLVKGSESLVGNVVSGNFYSAQPFGVVDGIDYCATGFPRKVEIERIRQVHETNDIVLLTSLGVSPSGEIFNVNSEFLAATVAGAMSASKIIYFNVHGTSFQNKLTGKPVQNLRVSDAKNLLAHYKMRIHPKGFAQVDLDGNSPQQSALRTPGSMETLIKMGYSMVALEKGVKRAHILAPENGALIQELYTRDGCGTLISRDLYEGIRRADVNDVSGIYDLIDPLVRSGTLVERPKSKLEKEILSYYVYTRDGLIVATGQLKRFEGGFAEIGCLVVSSEYRRGGKGDAMLGYLERLSLQCGAMKVFVLSTQTMEWFVERGFREVQVESLPPSRQALYNKKRNSKIYMKEIDGDRDLDAAELWWSNK